MYIYIISLIFILLVYLTVYYTNIRNKWSMIISFSYLFFISSFRDKSIGPDYHNYVKAFNVISKTGNYYMEKGYVLLNYVVSKICNNYIAMALTVNIILFVPLYYYIKNNVKDKYWWLCGFVFFANPYMFIQSTFNIVRQGCATGIIIIAMMCIFSKKIGFILRHLLFFSLVIVASMFHRTSIIMLLLPFFLMIKWKKVYWYIALGISFVGNVIGIRVIGSFLIKILNLRFSYLDASPSVLNRPAFLVFIALYVLYILYRYDDICMGDSNCKKKVDLYILSLCFYILTLPNEMFFRVYIMMAFIALPGIPLICEGAAKTTKIRIKNEETLITNAFLLYYFFYYLGYVILLEINNNYHYIPYKFFWQ